MKDPGLIKSEETEFSMGGRDSYFFKMAILTRDSTLLHFFSECGAKEIPGTIYVIRQMDKGHHCPKGCGF